MKTRLATALSIAGVLVAGSAAALANTRILDGDEPASGASAAVLPDAQPVDLTIPTSTSHGSTSTNPSTSTSVPSTVPSTSAEPTTSEQLTTFNVGSAGSVTLDVIAGRLRLVEAAPGAGWVVSKGEEDGDANEVEVEFRSATAAVEFEADLVDGVIVPDVSSRSLAGGPTSTTTVSATSAAPTVTFDDDGDDGRDDDNSGPGNSDDRDDRDDDNSGPGNADDRDDDGDDRDDDNSGPGNADDRDDDGDDRDDD